MITKDRLFELLDYDPCTGVFAWKISRGNRKKGSLAGCVCGEGYLCIGVDGNLYHAHTVAWVYMFGSKQKSLEIDHINQDKLDNRISNLRLVSKSANQKNKGLQKNNKSGVVGVHWSNKENKWRVVVAGKSYGSFVNFEDAKFARDNI